MMPQPDRPSWPLLILEVGIDLRGGFLAIRCGRNHGACCGDCGLGIPRAYQQWPPTQAMMSRRAASLAHSLGRALSAGVFAPQARIKQPHPRPLTPMVPATTWTPACRRHL